MGCGCGGSGGATGYPPAPQVATPALRGPQAPGYAWTGPARRAALAEKQPAKKTG